MELINRKWQQLKQVKNSLDKRGFLRSTMIGNDRKRPGWELAYGKKRSI
jgi:hypothetical protein